MKTWQRLKGQPELLEQYWVREKVVDTIRAFFKGQGFHEVQTPIMVPVPSAEANLEVFETKLTTAKGKERRAFLILSPEYAIKKLLAAGVGNVFEITRAFRNNEEVSRQHNPEFTILEWYRTQANYQAVMEDFEQLFVALIKATQPEVDLKAWQYLEETYDVSTPWERLSVPEAFKRYTGIEMETLVDEKGLVAAAAAKGYQTDERTSWEQAFYQVFFNEIERKLKASQRPVFVYDYPLPQAALAKRKVDEPRLAERFEVFLAGLELGNCFSELTDVSEQEARLKQDLAERKRLGKIEFPIDHEFIEALESGLPEVAGIAVGVDRLVMLMANVESVAETLFFSAGELFDLE